MGDPNTTLTASERAAISRNIRRLCQAQNLTLGELAEAAGLSSVKMILERGSGRAASLRAIAEVLRVSIDELLAVEEGERPMDPELVKMLDSPMIGDVSDDEMSFLRGLSPPTDREMTARAYFLALEMFRATRRGG